MTKINYLIAGAFLLSLSTSSLCANDNININLPNASNTEINYNGGSIYDQSLTIQVDNIVLESIQNGYIAKLKNGTPLLQKGAPDLMKMTTSLIIPDHNGLEIEVLGGEFTTYNDIDLLPSKGNLTRDINPSDIDYTYGEVYNEDAFFPGKLADHTKPFIMRDHRGVHVNFYPIQYNPITKELKVYSSIDIRVKSSDHAPEVNPFNRTKTANEKYRDIEEMYAHQFINYSNVQDRALEEELDGNMLIIAYDDFMDEMEPFVEWKTMKGMEVEMVAVSSIGDENAIDAYVENYYNDNGLVYLLLVGDAAQVPPLYSSTASGESDIMYTYISGNDYYAELMVGRFSAENGSHVTTQVDRVIQYEKNTQAGNSNYANGIGIASNEGPGDDGEIDFEHMRNIRTDLLNYTYSQVGEYYDGSNGGEDASGNPSASDIVAEIEGGIGIINYVGHGSDNSCATSGISNNDLTNLTNYDAFPFFWSVACVNGNFANTTCFAETWLRASNTEGPTGAIATFMSTINQSWAPPMAAQDEMVDILTEQFPTNIKRTFGGLSINGTFQMNEEYQDYAMTDTWTIFGDPSTMVRTAVVEQLTVNHDPTVFIGATTMNVVCPEDGALVALTINGEIVATGYAGGGTALLSFDALSEVGDMTICVTAFNHTTYVGSVEIIPAAGPYVTYDSSSNTDGDNDGIVENNESVVVDMTLGNVGLDNTTGVTSTLTTSDQYVTITDNSASFGNINAGETSTVEDAFAYDIDCEAPDQHSILFTVVNSDDQGNSWNSYFTQVVNTPMYEVVAMSISGDNNGNGALDPNETATVTFTVENTGHADGSNLSLTASSNNSDVSFTSTSSQLSALAMGSSSDIEFEVTVAGNVSSGTMVELGLDLTDGCKSADEAFNHKVGAIVEDFETGDFTAYDWQEGGNSPWVIDYNTVYAGNNSSASGTIGDQQTSVMTLTLDCTQDDVIGFYYKVSSEDTYDFLKFFIDDVLQEEWSGEIDWTFAEYDVDMGERTFKWEYYKDYSVSSGDDKAWVDDIELPQHDMVGINESLSTLTYTLYPNPANEMINFGFEAEADKNYTISLLDMQGKLITTRNVNQSGGYNQMTFNTSALAEGLYQILINDGEHVVGQKFVVSK